MSAELHQRRVECMRRRVRRVFLIAGSDKKNSHCGDSRPQNVFSRTRIAVDISLSLPAIKKYLSDLSRLVCLTLR
jgi:hypothetical protein